MYKEIKLKAIRVLLRKLPFSIPKSLAEGNPDSAPFRYVTLCGVNHVDMLRESLLSVVRNWIVLPKFTIFSDGSMSCEEIVKKFSWLGKYLEVLSWEDALKYVDPIKEKLVFDFANKHVMGKKFAIILASGRRGSAFWCDSDVLWYKNFSLKNEINNEDQFKIIASADYQPSYSKNLLEIYPALLELPYVCAGIVLISGDMMKNTDLSSMLTASVSAPDHFSEQTMVARVTIENGAKIWSTETIACFEYDKGSRILPTFRGRSWAARHYVSPVRHLFWRDALYSRLLKILV